MCTTVLPRDGTGGAGTGAACPFGHPPVGALPLGAMATLGRMESTARPYRLEYAITAREDNDDKTMTGGSHGADGSKPRQAYEGLASSRCVSTKTRRVNSQVLPSSVVSRCRVSSSRRLGKPATLTRRDRTLSRGRSFVSFNTSVPKSGASDTM